MRTRQSEEDLRLRRLLRRGDPADGECLPAAQDLGRMRRQIVEQSGANESLAPRLGLRWVAVAACVLILAVVGWQLRDPSVRPTVVPQIAEAHADTPVPVPVVEVEEAPVVSDVAEAIETVVEEPTVAEGGDSSAENLQARTLRFTTQRGTQIIWIIDPELEL